METIPQSLQAILNANPQNPKALGDVAERNGNCGAPSFMKPALAIVDNDGSAPSFKDLDDEAAKRQRPDDGEQSLLTSYLKRRKRASERELNIDLNLRLGLNDGNKIDAAGSAEDEPYIYPKLQSAGSSFRLFNFNVPVGHNGSACPIVDNAVYDPQVNPYLNNTSGFNDCGPHTPLNHHTHIGANFHGGFGKETEEEDPILQIGTSSTVEEPDLDLKL